MGRDVENGGGTGAVRVHALPAPRMPTMGGSRTGGRPPDFAVRSAATATAESLARASGLRRAAGLAILAGLAVVAGLAALGAAVALVGAAPGATNRVLSFADLVGPDNAVARLQNTVADAMARDSLAALVLVAAVAATTLFGAGYLRAFRRIVPAIGEARQRPRLRVRELPLVLGFGLGFAAVLVALVLTGPSARAAVVALGGGDHALTLWSIGKWPLIAGVFASLFLLIQCLVVSPHPAGRRVVTDSQLAAAALWAIAIVGFVFYLANFNSFDQTFGNAGSAVVSILWLALFSILYYGTPSLSVDGFGPVLPGLGVALTAWLAICAVLALAASLLDPFSSISGAVALGVLALAWLWLSSYVLLLGSAFDVELGRRQPETRSETEAAAAPEAPPEAPPEAAPRAAPEQAELERIVRIALVDDAAHRGMWSALPGGPDEVPSVLTGLECDLNDWGFAYGVAWAVAKRRYPFEPDREVAERALEAARTVFGEYCAGENWSERLAERRPSD
jgi:membrane protein